MQSNKIFKSTNRKEWLSSRSKKVWCFKPHFLELYNIPHGCFCSLIFIVSVDRTFDNTGAVWISHWRKEREQQVASVHFMSMVILSQIHWQLSNKLLSMSIHRETKLISFSRSVSDDRLVTVLFLLVSQWSETSWVQILALNFLLMGSGQNSWLLYTCFLSCNNVDIIQFSSVQLLSRVWLFVTPWTTARQAFLSITNCWSILKLMSIELVMPSNHLILCHPLLLLPSICPIIRVSSNESALHIRWPKYWSFSFNISLSNEHPGLISFRMDWLDLLAVQGTLKSLLQYHSSKALIIWCSAFFIVQLSYPYMTTGKTIALTRWTFVSKVMSLLFNMLSR